jgi:cell division septation protein DedD
VTTRYEEDADELTDSGREISLGPATILGIFFLLVITCGIFFGFGYTFGRKSTPAPLPPATAENAEPGHELSTTGAPKPRPGMAMQSNQSADEGLTTAQVERPAEPPTPEPQQVPAPVATPKAAAAIVAPTRTAPAATRPPAIIPASSSAAPAGPPALVQIAAVSHEEDAQTLATYLRRRGYEVAVRQVPTDKLYHVQIGPLPTKKDAEAMRQRLIADGYNAIVK